MKQYPLGFLVAWTIVGAVALSSFVGFLAIMFTPATPVAHKKDLNKALESTDKALIIQAKKNIASQAASASVTINSQTAYKVTHPSSNEADIYMKVDTVEDGTLKFKVVFHKGIYTISKVVPA